MPKYIIEREVLGVGEQSLRDQKAGAMKSRRSWKSSVPTSDGSTATSATIRLLRLHRRQQGNHSRARRAERLSRNKDHGGENDA